MYNTFSYRVLHSLWMQTTYNADLRHAPMQCQPCHILKSHGVTESCSLDTSAGTAASSSRPICVAWLGMLPSITSPKV